MGSTSGSGAGPQIFLDQGGQNGKKDRKLPLEENSESFFMDLSETFEKVETHYSNEKKEKIPSRTWTFGDAGFSSQFSCLALQIF